MKKLYSDKTITDDNFKTIITEVCYFRVPFTILEKVTNKLNSNHQKITNCRMDIDNYFAVIPNDIVNLIKNYFLKCNSAARLMIGRQFIVNRKNEIFVNRILSCSIVFAIIGFGIFTFQKMTHFTFK